MRKLKIKKNRIIKAVTYYMGFVFYFSAGALTGIDSKFALIMCLVSVTWLVSVFQGSLLLKEEKEAKKEVSADVLH